MKNIFLFFFIVLLTSCVSENIQKNTIFLSNGLNTMPDIKFQIFFKNGKIIKGKSDKYGVIIVKVENWEEYILLLDYESFYYGKTESIAIDSPILDTIFKDIDEDDWESIYLYGNDNNEQYSKVGWLYMIILEGGITYSLIFPLEIFGESM